MPIPKTRADLRDSLVTTFARLESELDAPGRTVSGLRCVDDWSVKDLLAVRAWWTEQVVAWIEAGRSGEVPVTPAPGYRWNETPQLNAEIIRRCRRESYKSIRLRLRNGYESALATIDGLSDRELLDNGVFEWAGSYPVARWLSINTTRQYTTARTYVRKALRERDG